MSGDAPEKNEYPRATSKYFYLFEIQQKSQKNSDSAMNELFCLLLMTV